MANLNYLQKGVDPTTENLVLQYENNLLGIARELEIDNERILRKDIRLSLIERMSKEFLNALRAFPRDEGFSRRISILANCISDVVHRRSKISYDLHPKIIQPNDPILYQIQSDVLAMAFQEHLDPSYDPKPISNIVKDIQQRTDSSITKKKS